MIYLCIFIIVVLITAPALPGYTGTTDTMKLIDNGNPAVKLVIAAKDKPNLLMKQSVETIASTVKSWTGVSLPVDTIGTKDKKSIDGPAVILGTLDDLRDVFPKLESEAPDISRAAFMNEQGFVCVRSGNRFFITSRTSRGVYNGAVYIRDFRIDGPEDALYVDCTSVFRTPWMQGRPVYLLNIWDHEQRYTVNDWKPILDSLARDGFDSVYFWMSGHFPSKKYPQTYKWKDGDFDLTDNTKIGTIKDLQEIIRYGHNMGLRMYIGGGLGGWTGTGNLTNQEPGTMKTGEGIARYSLCPSNPKSQSSLIGYYNEIFDALPEADGLYIEMADEWGECTCPTCKKPLDSYGSKQYGKSQLAIIHEMANQLWKKHPHACFALTNGYAEHAKDPAFYETLRQMSDPRFEWMEARNSWEFPGPEGKSMPATYFTRKQMKWHIWETMPLEAQIETANRVAKDGWYGMIADFSPGFCSGSFYTTRSKKGKNPMECPPIPFPTDILPHVLTYFVTREVTWEPMLTADGVRERIQQRFFGASAPKELSQDLWTLRELIRTSSASGAITPEQVALLKQIQGRTESAAKDAGPKTRDGLSIMDRAIKDTRTFFGIEAK